MPFTFQPYRPYNSAHGSGGDCDTTCIIILSSVFGGLFFVCLICCGMCALYHRCCQRAKKQPIVTVSVGQPYERPLTHLYATTSIV